MNKNTSKGAFAKGLSHIEAKYYVEELRLTPTSIDRYGNGSTTTLPLEVFTQSNSIADIIRLNALHLYLVGKRVGDLLREISKHLSFALAVETL